MDPSSIVAPVRLSRRGGRAGFLLVAVAAAVLTILALAGTAAAQYSDLTKQLLANYDNTTRPGGGTATPTEIDLSMRVVRVFGVDPKNSVFTADVFLYQRWIDPRLKYTATSAEPIHADYRYFWRPDTFFYNSQDASEVLDSSFTIQPNGRVFFSQHFLTTLNANFTLQSFPFDDQDLNIIVAPFSYGSLKLNFTLDGNGFNPFPNYTYSSALWPLQDWYVESGILYASGVNITATTAGTPYVLWSLNVKRDPTTYVIKYLLPLFFVTFASTLSYWVSPDAVPARVAFGVSLLVSVISLNFIASADLPKVNYITKMDVFIAFAFLFVFIALIEFAAIHYLKTSGNVLLSKSIESFFRNTASIALILVAIIINVGFGEKASGRKAPTYALSALLCIFLVAMAVWSVIKHMGEAAKARAKKNDALPSTKAEQAASVPQPQQQPQQFNGYGTIINSYQQEQQPNVVGGYSPTVAGAQQAYQQPQAYNYGQQQQQQQYSPTQSYGQQPYSGNQQFLPSSQTAYSQQDSGYEKSRPVPPARNASQGNVGYRG
ncbi:neurotransmitter-gated ion-channel ligand-binding domain-containing protein [Zopfochytrium polystomum]|nr:neurotransmitter-gated ion-channel ligand-binding domain-containing protein [Zopfochytrium polystomum]